MWKFYLLAAAGASRARDGQLYHLVLTKIGPQAARLPHELSFSSGGIGGTNVAEGGQEQGMAKKVRA